MRTEMMSFFKVEDEAQATALHQLSEVGIYDFWTEVSKTICAHMLNVDFNFLFVI